MRNIKIVYYSVLVWKRNIKGIQFVVPRSTEQNLTFLLKNSPSKAQGPYTPHLGALGRASGLLGPRNHKDAWKGHPGRLECSFLSGPLWHEVGFPKSLWTHNEAIGTSQKGLNQRSPLGSRVMLGTVVTLSTGVEWANPGVSLGDRFHHTPVIRGVRCTITSAATRQRGSLMVLGLGHRVLHTRWKLRAALPALHFPTDLFTLSRICSLVNLLHIYFWHMECMWTSWKLMEFLFWFM